jgi:hypothetical protein
MSCRPDHLAASNWGSLLLPLRTSLQATGDPADAQLAALRRQGRLDEPRFCNGTALPLEPADAVCVCCVSLQRACVHVTAASLPQPA